MKVDAINWMMSKMAVRKNIISNMRNQHVCDMLSSTLWDPDIFPDEAFVDLRTRGQGRKLESLLGIKGTMPKEVQNWSAPSTNANSNPRSHEPPQKKHKPNPQMLVSNTPQAKQVWNKRGNRGGKKHQQRQEKQW